MTFEVVLHAMKNLRLHYVSIHRKFILNQLELKIDSFVGHPVQYIYTVYTGCPKKTFEDF